MHSRQAGRVVAVSVLFEGQRSLKPPTYVSQLSMLGHSEAQEPDPLADRCFPAGHLVQPFTPGALQLPHDWSHVPHFPSTCEPEACTGWCFAGA